MKEDSILLDAWLALASLFRRSNLKISFMREIVYSTGYMSSPEIKKVLLNHFSNHWKKKRKHWLSTFLPDTVAGTKDAAMYKPKLPQEIMPASCHLQASL